MGQDTARSLPDRRGCSPTPSANDGPRSSCRPARPRCHRKGSVTARLCKTAEAGEPRASSASPTPSAGSTPHFLPRLLRARRAQPSRAGRDLDQGDRDERGSTWPRPVRWPTPRRSTCVSRCPPGRPRRRSPYVSPTPPGTTSPCPTCPSPDYQPTHVATRARPGRRTYGCRWARRFVRSSRIDLGAITRLEHRAPLREGPDLRCSTPGGGVAVSARPHRWSSRASTSVRSPWTRGRPQPHRARARHRLRVQPDGRPGLGGRLRPDLVRARTVGHLVDVPAGAKRFTVDIPIHGDARDDADVLLYQVGRQGGARVGGRRLHRWPDRAG